MAKFKPLCYSGFSLMFYLRTSIHTIKMEVSTTSIGIN